MNILILGSGSYKSSLTFRVVALGKQLARLGNQVSLMVPSADKYNNFTVDPKASLEGIRLLQPWQLTTRSATLNLIPYLCTSLVTILRSRPQLVYLYKPTPVTILGLLPRFLFRTPVVLDLDDLGSEVMEAQGQAKLQVWLVAACERLALRYATAVVVTSTFLGSIVQEAYPDKPILILSNGVDVAEYPPVVPQRPRHAIYYFGAVNRLSLVESVLRAMPATLAAIPDTKLYLLGGGSALNDAKRLVNELGIEKAVISSGWIDMYEAARYAQFADLAVCYQPNTRTVRAASNMKVFQYMAMGMVPVVSDVGDLRQYVRGGQAGAVVSADDPEGLAKTFVALLNNDAGRRKLAQAARSLAESEYSWGHLAGRLQLFLQAQMDGKHAKEGRI